MELLKVELQMVVDGAESRAADGVGMGEGWQATDEDTMWAEGPPPHHENSFRTKCQSVKSQ